MSDLSNLSNPSNLIDFGSLSNGSGNSNNVILGADGSVANSKEKQVNHTATAKALEMISDLHAAMADVSRDIEQLVFAAEDAAEYPKLVRVNPTPEIVEKLVALSKLTVGINRFTTGYQMGLKALNEFARLGSATFAEQLAPGTVDPSKVELWKCIGTLDEVREFAMAAEAALAGKENTLPWCAVPSSYAVDASRIVLTDEDRQGAVANAHAKYAEYGIEPVYMDGAGLQEYIDGMLADDGGYNPDNEMHVKLARYISVQLMAMDCVYPEESKVPMCLMAASVAISALAGNPQYLEWSDSRPKILYTYAKPRW